MKYLKHILFSFLLLFSGFVFSQNKLITSGSNFIAVGDNLLSTPFNQYSLNFDGVDENIICGNDASLSFDRTDKFSISVWLKRGGGIGTTQGILNKYKLSLISGYAFGFNASNGIFFRLANTQGTNVIERRGSTVITDTDNWYNLLVTYDGSSDVTGIKLYVNSIRETEITVTNSLTGTTLNAESFRIGIFATGFLFFNGNIDEISVWKRELNPNEINEIYNDGIPNNLLFHSAAVDLVAWFRMGDGDTFSTDWTLTDKSINNNTGTSVNMEFLDRTHAKP